MLKHNNITNILKLNFLLNILNLLIVNILRLYE